jgi:multidrug efflux pump subunit AcrB
LGIRFDLRERNYFFSKDAQNYYYLLLLVIVLIWGISMVFFESVKQSLLVISLIPISFIGIFLIFYLFDFNFDQGGIAGFILVSGITVNAVYYILNDYNYLRKKHLETPTVNLYTQAFSHKIFPILLTILSTILGFIPFIIDGQNEVFWFSLAIATIGGLLFSLIGIFIYLPVLSLKR